MNSLYQNAQFLLSVPKLKDAPTDEGYEVAFAGRSNAGKSSAINLITSQKSLARTSKTPGRTQHLVFFELDDQRRLVDLPGYGYAKVPERVKAIWHKTMESFLIQRDALKGIFLLMDIRHPLTNFDTQMIEWCELSNLPLHIALTKSDKLKYGAAKNTLLDVRRKLKHRDTSISVQLFSAPKRVGLDEAHEVLDGWFEVSEKKKDPEV
ncbi:MAG: ribosome biogenesis GTP-binding protein YihA/YsxC [Methylococcales bacterium]